MSDGTPDASRYPALREIAAGSAAHAIERTAGRWSQRPIFTSPPTKGKLT